MQKTMQTHAAVFRDAENLQEGEKKTIDVSLAYNRTSNLCNSIKNVIIFFHSFIFQAVEK